MHSEYTISLLDNAPNYLPSWVRYPKEKGKIFGFFGKNFHDCTYYMMFLLLLFFRPLSTKANNNATTAESSEDELNGYDKVVVSQNLAEEILDEIYGKIEAFNPVTTTTATQVYENSVVNENGAIDAPFHLHDPNINQPKSLADEILDELYGRKSASNGSGPSSPRAALGHQKSGISKKKVELAVVDHPYEEIQSRTKISSADLEHSPAITGKISHVSFFPACGNLGFQFSMLQMSARIRTRSLYYVCT